jgi:MFS transporter, DHA2 family, multidrug resistance protein
MFEDPSQRAVALGIWTASFALGGILGPLVGGVLIEAVSWRAVFLVTPAVMVVLLGAGPFLLPEHRDARAPRIDGPGVVLAIAGVLSATYAIKQVADSGDPVVSVVTGISGVALLVGFVRRQRRVPHPILDLGLFHLPAFTVPLVGNALAFAVLFGTQLLIGQYLQAVLGMSPLQAGVWTIPSAAAYALGGLLAPRLGSRFGADRLLVAGLAVSALGFGLVAGVGTSTGLLALVLGSVVYSLGLAPVYQLTTDTTVASLPADRAGVAGATLETLTNLGGALGIALFGSLAGALYRSGTAGTGTGTQSIGDALATATRLPPAESADLVRAARDAFVAGFRLTELAGAALLLLAAVATLPILRRASRRRSTPP